MVACGGSDSGVEASGTGGTTPGAGGAVSTSGGAIGAGGAVGSGAGGVIAAGGAIGAGGAAVIGGAPGAGGATGSAGAGAGGAPVTMTVPQDATFQMDGFSVPPGGEFYKCQDFPNPFSGNIAILESKSVMTMGSHHMFVFRLTTDGFYGGTPNLGAGNTKGPLVDCPSGGTEFHPFVHAAQSPEQEFTYPDGLGQAFNSNETPRVMVHYLNTTTDPIQASLVVTMKYVAADQVKNLAASVFLNSVGVKVPPGTSTQSFTYKLPQDVNLLAASGHMHRRGTHFSGTAVGADGKTTQLYQTDDWNEPMPAAFDPAIALANGTTIKWACSYNNDTGKTLKFGESANTNEMCIFTGTYYPAPGGGGIYDQDLTAGTSSK
jgi:hypothetical protein